ncbi:MAG: DUF4097 family beta strand repeat-containing protein [Lachnospiraceae bacterium]|nr:DUF4097 family beta strand repeat-containing protein [Lachnospiraceae bacterium]
MEKMMTSGPETQTGENGKEIRRTRRVGSFTCGLMLVLYGILFLVHIIQPKLDYSIIFELWPLILIFLGVEILVSCTNKNQEKGKFVYDFWAVILVFVVAFFAMIMSVMNYGYETYDNAYNDAGSSGIETVSGSKDFAAKDINSISLNNELWDVKVMPSNDNDIHVSYSGTVWRNKDDAVQFSQVKNGIAVDIKNMQEYRNAHWFFYWGPESYNRIRGEMTLYLPETDSIALKLDNNSGNMSLQDISCKELVLGNDYGSVKLENVVCAAAFSYDNDSGDVNLKNVSCDGLTLSNNYGNVKLEDIACANAFSYTNDSGNIKFTNVTCKGLTLSNNFGSSKFENVACTSFDFTNDSGNIEIVNSSCGDFALSNEYGSLDVDNTSFGGFSLSNDSGSVSIKEFSAKDVKVITKMGSVVMSEGTMEGAKIETDSGSLTFSDVAAGSIDIDSEYGEVNIKNIDSQTETSISSDSGNVRIRYKDRPENLAFDVKSDYGSIRIGLENVKYDYNLDTDKRGMIGDGLHHTSITTESGGIVLED